MADAEGVKVRRPVSDEARIHEYQYVFSRESLRLPSELRFFKKLEEAWYTDAHIPGAEIPWAHDPDQAWYVTGRVRREDPDEIYFRLCPMLVQPVLDPTPFGEPEPKLEPLIEWRWVESGGAVRSGIYHTLAGALSNAEVCGSRTKPIGIQRWNGRMEVVWYGWDKWNRLKPAHTLPKVHIDPNCFED